jgi:hypothetical protein
MAEVLERPAYEGRSAASPQIDGTWKDPAGNTLTLTSTQVTGTSGYQVTGTTSTLAPLAGFTLGAAVTLSVFDAGQEQVESMVGVFNADEGNMVVMTGAVSASSPSQPAAITDTYKRQ